MNNYIIITLLIIVFIIGLKNKVNCYESFIEGVKEGTKISVNMFSNLLVFMIALSFLFSSGLIEFVENNFNFKYTTILIQMLIRPLSASASLSILVENYSKYGVDSFISIMSSMIHYVSDATLYLVPFYCGIYKINKQTRIIIYGIVINLFSYLISILLVSLFIY